MSKIFFDNSIANKLKNKEKVSAAWAQLNSNISAEIFAEAGFDVLVIDAEHSPTHLPSMISMMQATKGTNCVPFVRAAWNDAVMIKQILDIGAYGIHIPYVSTKEEAEYAVKCCKYAPEGFRGVASSQRAVNYSLNKTDYYNRANTDIIIMVAIETPEGVDNIEDIISVKGVDGIFIGPSDLSASMGFLANPSSLEVQQAIKKIETAVLKSDKFLSTIAPDFNSAKVLYDKGYSLVYMMSDTTALAKAASNTVNEFKQYLQKR